MYKVFNHEFFESVKQGRPFFGHFDLIKEYDWTLIHDVLRSGASPHYGADWKRHNPKMDERQEHLIPECSIIANEMRNVFYDHLVESQLFANKKNGLSTLEHADTMDVFFMQLEGQVQTLEVLLEPGDWVWYPRGYPHSVQHSGKRISLSIGVNGEPNPKDYYKELK